MSTRSSSERLLRAAAPAVLAAALLACQRPSDPPEVQAARAAVARYDERLPAVFRAGDQSLLGDAASEAETDRVGAIVAGLATRGEVMIARLTDFRVERARVTSPQQVVVETVETWWYEHRPASDPRPAGPARGRRYRMSYQVGLERGTWVVEHAAVREETELAPER